MAKEKSKGIDVTTQFEEMVRSGKDPFTLVTHIDGKPIDRPDRVDGMPVKAIKKLLENEKTPEPIKRAWRKKLSKMGKVI